MNELAYMRGERAAWDKMLRLCLVELGYNGNGDVLVTLGRLIAEREAVVAQLRHVCEIHGDNEWEPQMHLGDVIDKHLMRHLESKG